MNKIDFQINIWWSSKVLMECAMGKQSPISTENIKNEIQTNLENDDQILSFVCDDLRVYDDEVSGDQIEELFNEMKVSELMEFINIDEDNIEFYYDDPNSDALNGFIPYSYTCSFDVDKFIDAIKKTHDNEEEIEEEEVNFDEVFRNLGATKAEQLYKEFLDKGMSEDDAFNEVYSMECNMDEDVGVEEEEIEK